jgi:hypothetical protein
LEYLFSTLTQIKNKTMNKPVIAYVGWLLLAAALGFYGYGIFEAVSLSWSAVPGKEIILYPEVLSTTIGSIQALLLANLGMVLGISIADPGSGIAKAIMLNKSTVLKTPPPPLEVKEKVQLFSLVLYIIVLITCLVTWIVNGFSLDPKNVVSIIPESGKMFIGVVLAYLTAALSK